MRMPIIHIISLNGGNVSSVANALDQLGIKWKIGDSIEALMNAENLILPGIGHFGSAMDYLNDKGFTEVLRTKILDQKTPTLGICLGMQLLAKSSSEGSANGLEIFDASVEELKATDTLRYKVPHNGWNTVRLEKECALLDGIKETDEFFFLHKYVWKSNTGSEVFATSDYESTFPSIIGSGNCWGVQFHPEKSHEAGLQLIKNFAQHVCSVPV